MTRRFRIAGWTLCAAVAVAGLVEVVHHVGRYLEWRADPLAPTGPPRAGVVLVLGDDGVFGRALGLPRPPWPERVAASVAGTRPAVEVVTVGRSGWSSADVVRALPEQLAAHAPELVYVVAGSVDLRRGVAEVVEDLSPGALPFFTESYWGSVLASSEPADSAASPWFVGDWHVADVPLTFGADGGFRLGPTVGTWSGAAAALTIELPGLGPIDAVAARRGERLLLSGGFPGGRLDAEPGPPPGSPFERVRGAIERGEFAIATFLLRAATAGRVPDVESLTATAELAAASGDREAFDRARAGLVELGANQAVARADRLVTPRDLDAPVTRDQVDPGVVEAVVANLRIAGRVAGRYGSRAVLVVPASSAIGGAGAGASGSCLVVDDWSVAGIAAAVTADLARRLESRARD